MSFFKRNSKHFQPYVKITIKNKEKIINQTKTYKKDVDFKNPIWMELFEFNLIRLKNR